MRISPDAPVVWGVVTAVLITVSAFAGAVITSRDRAQTRRNKKKTHNQSNPCWSG